jgi:CHRD domain
MRKRVLAVGLGVAVAAGGGAGMALAKGDVLSATLNAKQEIPKQTVAAPNGKGSFTGTLTGRRLRWKLTFSGLTGKALAAHIHLAKAGKGNPVPAVPLCTPCRSGVTGVVTLTNKVENAIKASGAYVNVHTAKNPSGEIRGQIKFTST